jgi:transcriptional regulator with XRE-family HTH domain
MKRTNIAEKIKKIVRETGFTQQKFAKKIGIGESMISQWLAGKITPSLSSLKKISKATGVPLNFFLDSSENVGNISGNSNIVFGSSGNIIGQGSINSSKDMELLKKENELLKRELEIERKEKELLKSSKKA